MFGQLLAQQKANNSFVDLANGVKSIRNFGLNINFSRDIIIEAKKKVSEKIKKYYIRNFFQKNRSKLSYKNRRVVIC